jgi:phosphocarrier protein HPr
MVGEPLVSEDRNNGDAITRELEILNQYGIHARPAALFVKTASRFDAEITVERGGNKVSGKSIMGLMTLEASKGTTLTVTVEGEDAEEAITELEELVASKFDEE